MTTPTAPPQRQNLDRFLVLAVATTTDEHGVYVTKDSAEVIELGWILLDAKTLDEVNTPLSLVANEAARDQADVVSIQVARDSVLVKPINTPITPLCSMFSQRIQHVAVK